MNLAFHTQYCYVPKGFKENFIVGVASNQKKTQGHSLP